MESRNSCVQAGDAKSLAADLRFTIPPRLFAVVARACTIYVDNVILTQSPASFAIEVSLEQGGRWIPIGTNEPRFWTFTPDPSHAGSHRIRVRLMERNDGDVGEREIESVMSELVVAAADAGVGKSLSLLIVGDSLTHASQYPNALSKMLSQPGNPTWTMLGRHRPAGIADGVAHEGFGGWTWERFANHYVPNSDTAELKMRGSPFVFVDGSGQPQLDPAKYFDTQCGGQRPGVILFLLGINDCFGAPPDKPEQIDERIDVVFKHAERLLASMHNAAPEADLVVCLTTPPNSRQEAFEANYQDRYKRWGWKRIQHRLVEREIKQFANRGGDRIFLAPTELNVDPTDGYPVNNAVHPNAIGYQQVAESLFAWLKCRLSTTAGTR